MRNLSQDDFAAGTRYDVAQDGADVPLELVAVEPLAGSDREGGAFRLELSGPADPVLPQAIYALRGLDGRSDEIFIVPIARDSAGTRYEAIFY
jgi:hypothetical protein